MEKRYDRVFITGCDKHTEWMLPWFLKNYNDYNNDPIVFCDFGVSKEMLKWCHKNFDDVIENRIFEREKQKFKGPAWWLKPLAICEVNGHKKVWLDTDCEVLRNISSIFDHLEPNKINLVQDRPWSKRRGEIWHNTGVVGVIGIPTILVDWIMECQKIGGGFTFGDLHKGDQDALHEFIGQDAMRRWSLVHDLPNKYNWLRLQLYDGHDDENKLIIHWTGRKGKDEIRKKI